MILATTNGQTLQYFIHYDFDALRMGIAGSLIGKAARKAYDAWRSSTLLARQLPRIVDISYVTEADEDGRAVLREWQEQDVRIVASSNASRVIANSILSAPAGNPARAEGPAIRSASA
jgi:hypothetical protein